jgi:Arc-like DNA binding domain
MSGTKKRLGRPPKSEKDRKAVNFTFRSRGQMRERLQGAAASSGRSVSEEIEYRLDQSFTREPLVSQLVGGNHNAKVLELIADALNVLNVMRSHDLEAKNWTEREIAEIFRIAVDLIIASWGGLPEQPPQQDAKENIAKALANQMVPEMEGRRLAMVILEAAGLPWPPTDSLEPAESITTAKQKGKAS